MTEPLRVEWGEMREQAAAIAERWSHADIGCVYGIPMGGWPVAMLVSSWLDCEMAFPMADLNQLLALEADGQRVLVVDDLVDSGRTMQPYHEAGLRCDAMYRKRHSPASMAPQAEQVSAWLQFPWERGNGPEDAVVRLLEGMGEDPTREGLRDTPRRVVKAMREMTNGLGVDPASVLGTTFTEPFGQAVYVRGIRFTSMCEHHLLPFVGTATVAYLPSDRVVGLSKVPRLVEVLAHRPQLQERLTREIADTLGGAIGALAVGVAIRAHHSCMGCRGVRQPDAEMVTVCLRGDWAGDDSMRRRLEEWA